jgi:tRNA (guanine37-N1)-methyltransferase
VEFDKIQPGLHAEVTTVVDESLVVKHMGGAGVLSTPSMISLMERAGIQAVQERFGASYVILLSPQGILLQQRLVHNLAQQERLLLICGRYGGVDARVQPYLDAEISIGDYVVTGGELPALVVLDAVGRLIPNVVGDAHSVQEDSFFHGLLQGPVYTRPVEFAGMQVPAILRSGDHAAVAAWRRHQALLTTLQRRPELLSLASLTPQDQIVLQELQAQEAHQPE